MAETHASPRLIPESKAWHSLEVGRERGFLGGPRAFSGLEWLSVMGEAERLSHASKQREGAWMTLPPIAPLPLPQGCFHGTSTANQSPSSSRYTGYSISFSDPCAVHPAQPKVASAIKTTFSTALCIVPSFIVLDVYNPYPSAQIPSASQPALTSSTDV